MNPTTRTPDVSTPIEPEPVVPTAWVIYVGFWALVAFIAVMVYLATEA